jgi:hypothetical protein
VTSDPTRDPELCRSLEEEAAALERLTGETETDESMAKLRALLVQLDATGFFAPHLCDQSSGASADALRRFGCPLVASYVEAGCAVRAYLASRARFDRLGGGLPSLGEDGAVHVVGAPVSVDWFRRRRARGAVDDLELLAAAEELLHAYRERLSGDAVGELIRHDGSGVRTLRWRRDDGTTPAVVSYDN